MDEFVKTHVHRDPHDTEVAAAESQVERAASDAVKVYAYLVRCGGSTDEEGMNALGMHSYDRRRSDLFKRGAVMDSRERRLTSRGRKAIVWVVVPKNELETHKENE